MRFNLILCFVWALIAVPVLLVNLAGVRIDGVPESQEAIMLGAVAALLAVYNFMRWYAGRMLARTRERLQRPPIRRRYPHDADPVYNPEFDFDQPKGTPQPLDEETQR